MKMGRKRTRKNAEKQKESNRQLMRRTLRGYKRTNQFTQAEERAWAAQLTPEEARQIFVELCQVWERGGAKAGGNWQAVDRLRIKELLKAQRPFAHLARRMRKS